MVFWRRIGQTKLNQLSHHLERCYFQASPGLSRHYIAPISLFDAKESSVAGIRRSDDIGFYSSRRFFAAPVQATPKKEKKVKTVRLNEQIKARDVRLVNEEGVHYVVPFHQALQEAKRLELDLVEVDDDAHPPVVKIMDYNMVRYKQQQHAKERAKERAKSTPKNVLKEVRFTVNTEAKDLAVKADGVKRALDRGYRVKCTATGTEDQDLGGLLARMFAYIENACIVETGPSVEKTQAYVIVRHTRFGLKRKGGKKKIDISAELQQQQAARAQSGDSSSIAEEEDLRALGSEETQEENLTDEDEEPAKVGFGWSTDGADYDDSTKVVDPRSKNSIGFSSDFQRPDQVSAGRAQAQPVTENRYAKKSEHGRGFPPNNSVGNNNRDRGSRDSSRFNPRERTQMPLDTPRQDRAYPNFPRNSSRVPPNEMQKPGSQRPGGPSPRDAGRSFGAFSNPRSDASNNQR